VRRSSSGIALVDHLLYVQCLREQAQAFRCRNGACAWALPSALLPDRAILPRLPGLPILLPDHALNRLGEFFEASILDLAYMPGRADALDGLPFISGLDLTHSREFDGFTSFRRHLNEKLSSVNTKSPR